MNEVLLKKIKYLLSFKFNSEEEKKYLPLLEKVFYEFVVLMEEKYNREVPQNTYYNFLLNKLNSNIKSIIIPSENFYYHSLSFLELSTDLNDNLKEYNNLGVPTTRDLKKIILKRNYFYYLLEAVKTTRESKGIISLEPAYLDKYQVVTGCRTLEKSSLYQLEKSFTMAESVTLTNLIKLYKVKTRVVYPDGTSHKYFNYYKVLDSDDKENLNIAKMLEVVIGEEELMRMSLEKDFTIIDSFNEKYDEILGNLRFDLITKERKYNCLNFFSKYMSILKEENNKAKKIEIIKLLNNLIFMMYDKKLTELLKKPLSKSEINTISKDIKTLEESMLYNEEIKFHNQMEHVQLLKSIKDKFKITMLKGGNINKNLKEYTIYSKDKKKERAVLSTVYPITLNNNIVTIEINKSINLDKKVLICFKTIVYSSDLYEKYNYQNIYLSVSEIKLLYNTSDFKVLTRESEKIRKLIAERIINPQIMDLIIKERSSFLGEFIYNKEQDKAYIFKNSQIVDLLQKRGNSNAI